MLQHLHRWSSSLEAVGVGKELADMGSTPGHHITIHVTLDVLLAMLSHFTYKMGKIIPSVEGFCE